MMPAARPDHREFLSDLNNVLTLLQAKDVYLLSSPLVADTWLTEGTMLIWKNTENAWRFKMPLLGEQRQGVFDTQIDSAIIQRLETLDINLDAPKEISAELGENLFAQITRPCFHLSLSQQNQIIAPLALAWPLTADIAPETQLQACLALLRGDGVALSEDVATLVNDFSSYLTLETINRLAGNSLARINEFRVTNNNTTSGDVFRFIQLLLLASAKKLGHDEPVVLPEPPAGHELVYGFRPVENGDNNAPEVAQLIQELLVVPDAAALRRLPLSAERRAAIDDFETALRRLETSAPEDLLAEDRERLTQSFSALLRAKTAWFASRQEMEHLITFRRATDEVLRADHIQRLYTHPQHRLGMFGGRVESQELQNLRLSLRRLRDFSFGRKTARECIYISKMVVSASVALGLAEGLLAFSLEKLAMCWLGSLLFIPAMYGMMLAAILFPIFVNGCFDGFSYDLWNTQIEVFREFFTNELPQAFAAVVALSAGYGLLVGEFSAAAGVLAMAPVSFLGAFLLLSSLMIGINVAILSLFVVGYEGYQAVSQLVGMMSEYVEDWRYGFNRAAPTENNRPEAIIPDEPEEIGLAPV